MDFSFGCWRCRYEDGLAPSTGLNSAFERFAMEELRVLKKNQWSGGAINVVAAVDAAAANWMALEMTQGRLLDNDAVVEGVKAQNGTQLHSDLSYNWEEWVPNDKVLAEVLGDFPTSSFSERDRSRQEDHLNELYSRITLRFTNIGRLVSCLKSKEMGKFDLVSIQPLDVKQFRVLLDMAESHRHSIPFDLISFRLSKPLPFKVSKSDLERFRKAKIFIELDFSELALSTDIQTRRVILKNMSNVLEHTSNGHLRAQGKFGSVIFSGIKDLRPESLISLGCAIGLSRRCSYAAFTSSCQAVLEYAECRRRRQGHLS